MARLVITCGVIAVVAAVAFFVMSSSKNGCSVSAIGGGGERIYLPKGTVYAWTNDPERLYHIVDLFSVHISAEQLEGIKCFDSPEKAEAAGYKSAIADIPGAKDGKYPELHITGQD